MLRRTKIVTTLGPACEQADTLEPLLQAGANVVRLDFSQDDADTHRRRAHLVRALAEKNQLNVAILADLQGPNINVQAINQEDKELIIGEIVTIECDKQEKIHSSANFFCNYSQLGEDCDRGDILVFSESSLRLRITDIHQHMVKTVVETAGQINAQNRLNKLGGGLKAEAITNKDRSDIDLALALKCEYIAVSFVSKPDDVTQVQNFLKKSLDGKQDCQVIAKIERAELASNHALLDQVIEASDGIMIARGDLGIEIGEPQLIGVQKHVIRRARTLNRVVITAAQMMESMINHSVPTRAEVFDVANAVLDGTDAVMCSNETAIGHYPVETVIAMADICMGAEKEQFLQNHGGRADDSFKSTDQAVAMSAMYAANRLKGVKAIVCLTETGSTPKWMSRIQSGLPIYALTRNAHTQTKCAMYRGVEPIYFDVTKYPNPHINKAACEELKQRGIVSDGDLVIISKGDHMGVLGGTNSLKIVSVGNIL